MILTLTTHPPLPHSVPYLPDLYTSLFIQSFMYSWRGYFLALLLHLASIFVLYQVLRGISSSHCKPTVKGFCPYHFGKICWVLFMVPCWLSFARFTFPVWSVASSGATQLHGCLVYTRHLNCLLLPPCTYGLILILLLLLLLPGFFSCWSLAFPWSFAYVSFLGTLPSLPRPPPTVAPIPLQIPFIPHCLSRLQHPPWPRLCSTIQWSLGLCQSDKWAALRASPAGFLK